MKRTLLSLTAVLLCVLSGAQVTRPTGINLAAVRDYSRELAFADAFRSARKWIPHEPAEGAAWSVDADPPLRADGYPTQVPFTDPEGRELMVRTILLTGHEGRLPAGAFRLVAEGEGALWLWGAANARVRTPIDTLITVDPSRGSVFLEIESSRATDPVRGIRFLYPEFARMPLGDVPTFRSDMLAFLEDFQVVRYMDWTATNNSEVSTWSERTTPQSYSQGLASGVAWEYVIALANATQTDAWICVPHLADDAYVESLARLFARTLDPRLKVYLEYSNELWNRGFSQARFAQATGAERGYPGQPWEQGWAFTGARSAEVFAVFEEHFPNANRLVKLLPTQGSNPFVSRKVIEAFDDPLYNPNGVSADALAIAPYFGGRAVKQIVDEGLVESSSVEAILDSTELSLALAEEWIAGQREVADEHGLRLVCYEAGQHLNNPAEALNDTTLTRKLVEANRHPRMGDLYCRYLDAWYGKPDGRLDAGSTQGGDLMCLFSSHGAPGRYGSWGVKEYMADVDAPKYRALQDCLFPYNTPESTSAIAYETAADRLLVYPNPTSGRLTIEAAAPIDALRAVDGLGREIAVPTLGLGTSRVLVDLRRAGVYFVRLRVGGEWRARRVVVTQ